MDSIWNKIKRDFKYQLKKLQNIEVHLKHLQLILIECDTIYTLAKNQLG